MGGNVSILKWLKRKPGDQVKTQENVQLVLRKGDNNGLQKK